MQNYNKGMSFALFTGKNRLHFQEIDSTNNYALQWVKSKRPPEGSLVTADFQTNGRGQRGNVWVSNRAENFMGSYIFYPVFLSASEQFWLNKAFSVGVVDSIKTFLPEKRIEIKWPNDILVDGKKIAGILIENQLQGLKLFTTIFGIGINKNQLEFNTLPQATSLALQNNTDISTDQIIDDLSSKLERRYLQVKAGNYSGIQDAYMESLFGIGKEINMYVNNQLASVRLLDVNDFGQVMVSSKEEIKVFSHGEAKILLD